MSIIKGVLLARITGDIPCLKGHEAVLGLFGGGAGTDADTHALSGLLNRISANCGSDAGWLETSAGKSLIRLIAANLRYNSPDCETVIFAAVEEALRHGPSYCFNGIGAVSRQFLSRYRAVTHEVHRMLGFIRFHPAPDNTLVCQPKLFHRTADIILRQFAPRYPGTKLVLLLDDKALALDGGKLTSVSFGDYRDFVLNDPFAAAWEKYYRSQYIATRKNISLAGRCVPKKYWDWLAEGRILAEEASR